MSTWSQFESYISTWSNWTGSSGVLHRLEQHLAYTAIAVAVAAAINVTNIGRAIPTFAILTLLILSPIGVSDRATEIALVLFALPPLVTNSYVGLSEIDDDLRDAARGMGMSGWQSFRRIELPLAMPLVMAGVRIAVVQVVATATIAALVGSGGLGRLIEDGLRQQDQGQLLTGAVVVGVLALLAEVGLALLQRRFDPMRRIRRNLDNLGVKLADDRS